MSLVALSESLASYSRSSSQLPPPTAFRALSFIFSLLIIRSQAPGSDELLATFARYFATRDDGDIVSSPEATD
ncbi:hypothetical protein HJFPF1_01538 [Paramyrothecium foliicola]|nr:hypothetical protein HJFPF1_01538 [Paramyrothecium foliicola]